MRTDALGAFLDRFGDVVYNSYNATEAGLISTATPQDLRVAPDTAGRPLRGTSVRILDDDDNELPTGEIGRIVVANNSGFDGYTGSDSKAFADGHMAFQAEFGPLPVYRDTGIHGKFLEVFLQVSHIHEHREGTVILHNSGLFRETTVVCKRPLPTSRFG